LAARSARLRASSRAFEGRVGTLSPPVFIQVIRSRNRAFAFSISLCAKSAWSRL
jgi:hypothetical protein